MIVSGAGEGNRTLVASLEGWSFTTKLHPLFTVFGTGENACGNPAASNVSRADGGEGWIRTNVGIANGFTARPL